MSKSTLQGLRSFAHVPAQVSQTLAQVAALDDCFLSGFAGLPPRQRKTLASFCAIFEDSSLHQSLQACQAALARHEFREKHFAALAAARSALLGAVYDALWQQAMRALTASPAGPATYHSRPQVPQTGWQPQQQVLMQSTRHWLMELALAGFSRLEPVMLHPFLATLEQIQADVELVGQGALLTGFLNELLAAGSRPPAHEIPTHRWVDLWARAMTFTLRPQVAVGHEAVSGDFYPLGCELLEHDHFASLVIWGLLQTNGVARCCRTTFSCYKAPVIGGDALWLRLSPARDIVEAIAARRALRIQGMPLLAGGDLIWDVAAQPGANFDPLELSARHFSPLSPVVAGLAPLPPAQRHPLQMALPLFVSGYRTQNGEDATQLLWDDAALPLSWQRAHPLLGLQAADAHRSDAMFGLLRFDAGIWSLQPLALGGASGKNGHKQTIVAGETGAPVLQKPPKHNAVTILQERAGRLLRAG